MFNLERLNPMADKMIRPFLEEVLSKYDENLHSIYVTGTSLTDDFDLKNSDVNSIFVLKQMDLDFLKLMAPLGKKYRKSKVAAPLIMTPEYIERSVDVFPIEFLNFKLIHTAVFGDDILKDIEIGRMDLRHQCERELKTKLIWLRQSYISSMGNMKALGHGLAGSISGYIPLFRAVLTLFEKEPPIIQSQVMTALAETTGLKTDAFLSVLKKKREGIKLSKEELAVIFKDFYTATERLGEIVDEIKD